MCKKVLNFPRTLLSAVLVALSFTACSPKIYTTISKTYPARPAGSYVAVFDSLENLSTAAEPLGGVLIYGKGTSACSYEQVVALAKKKTNETGGNGLLIEWYKGGLGSGSSCYRIQGRMFRLSDSLLYASSLQPQHTTVRERMPHSDFYIRAGYAFIVSDVKQIAALKGNFKQGFDLNAGYQWTSRRGIGVGVRYSGYFTSGHFAESHPDANVTTEDKVSIRLHYFAPELVLRQDLSRRFTFREAAGAGYASYSEGVRNTSFGIDGYGFHFDLSVEYRPVRDLSLSLGTGLYSARFSSMNVLVGNNRNAKAGITRISLNAGVQVYF